MINSVYHDYRYFIQLARQLICSFCTFLPGNAVPLIYVSIIIIKRRYQALGTGSSQNIRYYFRYLISLQDL